MVIANNTDVENGVGVFHSDDAAFNNDTSESNFGHGGMTVRIRCGQCNELSSVMCLLCLSIRGHLIV